MASCPKCKKHLHIYNFGQLCPHCGTNIRFYGFAEAFEKEAKAAELSNAVTHIKIRHIKAAFIGSRAAIARLAVMVLPLLGLLLPAARLELNIPFLEYTGGSYDFSLLGIISLLQSGGLNYISKMTASELFGSQFKELLFAFYAYAIAAVLALAVLLLCIFCFISYKNMQKITTIVAGLGCIEALIASIPVAGFVKSSEGAALFSANMGLGLFLTSLLFAVVFCVNLYLWIRGIPVEYDEGMQERYEIHKKIKKGELNIDELPQPIVETAETRRIEEEIRKQEDARRQKERQREEAESNA